MGAPEKSSLFRFPFHPNRPEKAQEVRPNLNRPNATSFSPETQYVRRPSTRRISFADRFNQSREREMSHNTRHRRSTQPGSANQIGFWSMAPSHEEVSKEFERWSGGEVEAFRLVRVLSSLCGATDDPFSLGFDATSHGKAFPDSFEPPRPEGRRFLDYAQRYSAHVSV